MVTTWAERNCEIQNRDDQASLGDVTVTADSPSETTPTPSDDPPPPPPAKKAKCSSSNTKIKYLQRIKRPEEKTNKSALSELNEYLACSDSEEIVNETDGIDAIKYWCKHKMQWPKLYKLFNVVLSVPASSAPVERVFSHGGIIFRPHRATMSDKNLSDVMLLKCNRL